MIRPELSCETVKLSKCLASIGGHDWDGGILPVDVRDVNR